MKLFSLYIPPELKEAAEKAAASQGINLSEYIRQAIVKALEASDGSQH